MDGRVDPHKHPDWRGHVPDTGPHAQHSAGVVVRLQRCAPLALGHNDERVKDFIELAEVKEPSPEGKTFVPHPAHIGGIGGAFGQQVDDGVLDLPSRARGIEGDGISETARAVDLAQRVGHTGQAVGIVKAGPDAVHCPGHGDEGHARVDGQEDVVDNDKSLEGAGFRYPPWLIYVTPVVGIDQGDRDHIDATNNQGDLDVQGAIVNVKGNCKRRPEVALVMRWGQRRRNRIRWKLEQAQVRMSYM